MSLINDALKRAQQTPPVIAPATAVAPPLQLATQNPVSVTGWLIPAVVIFLVVAAVFFIGWALAHRSMKTEVVVPEPSSAVVNTEKAVTVEEQPAIRKTVPLAVTTPAPKPEPVIVNPPSAPKLQGVFFSHATSSAILDGQTVYVGDTFKQFQVKAIDKTSVTLLNAGGQTVKVVMNH